MSSKQLEADLPRYFDACDLVSLLALLQATLVPTVSLQNSAMHVEKFATLLTRTSYCVGVRIFGQFRPKTFE